MQNRMQNRIQDEETLLYKFLPCFYFHSNEEYFITSIEDYIFDSSLWWKGDESVKRGILTKDKLVRYGDDTSLQPLDVHGEYSNNVPIYGKIDYYPDCIELKYILLFKYSGPIGPCNSFGAHPGDIEHVTVKLDLVTQEITSVYFSAHSGGTWVPKEKLDFHSEDRIVVYIARSSHAMYHTSGWKPRIFFFGNDYCDAGLPYNPLRIVRIDTDTDWVKYRGKIGTVTNLGKKRWFNDCEDQETWNTCDRLFGCWKW